VASSLCKALTASLHCCSKLVIVARYRLFSASSERMRAKWDAPESSDSPSLSTLPGFDIFMEALTVKSFAFDFTHKQPVFLVKVDTGVSCGYVYQTYGELSHPCTKGLTHFPKFWWGSGLRAGKTSDLMEQINDYLHSKMTSK